MISKRIRNISLILCLVLISGRLGFNIGKRYSNNFSSSGDKFGTSLMSEVRDRLGKNFLEKDKLKDEKEMIYGAVEGMVASLDDPYTVFLSPKNNKSSNEDLLGKFGGVGISLGYKDKTLAVMSTISKSPAEKAMLMGGDLILRIVDKENKVDKDTSGITLNEAVDLIRGKKGSKVTLKMYRDSSKKNFDVELTREEIVVPSVELEWKEKDGKKVAWIKLNKFSEQLYDEWVLMVRKIKSEKGNSYGGIVLDLRNNPGGYLQGAVMVASDFVQNKIIVMQEDANGKKENYYAERNMGSLLDDKMVILVNGGSASASEILAGALKEFGRAKLVGEKTFGKGTVQQPEELPDGSGLHITIAKWLLPSGKNIHKEGVNPDVEVKYEIPKELSDPNKFLTNEERKKLPDNQIEKAIEELLKK